MVKNTELDKLISAALVSRNFRAKLLREPENAIHEGYNGEAFNIPPDIVNMLSQIKAPTLSDFVQELVIQSGFCAD